VAPRYRWDDFLLDLDTYRLERAGVPLSLEPKAFNLLLLMIRRPGHLFSKQEIFDAIWPGTAVTDHALTRVVAQLRRALGDEVRGARYLETVPTRGYRWIRPVEEILSGPAPVDVARRFSGASEGAETPAAGLIVPPRAGRVFVGLASALMLAVVSLGFLVWTRPTLTSAKNADRAGADLAGKRTRGVQWPVQLTTHDGLDLQPSLSPQGDAVAFASDQTGSFEIYVRAFAGTAAEMPLTNDGAQNVQPAWSPDGRSLAYHSNRHGGIWVVAARGGVPRQVAPSGSSPVWSPDSLRLAFQSDEDVDVAPTGFNAQSGSTIWTVGADGRDLRELTRPGQPIGGHGSPAWSPDGRYLAFTVYDGGSNNGIWILTLESRETRSLATGPGLFESAFAPDGSAVYVAGSDALVVRIPFDRATGSRRGEEEIIPIAGVPGVRGMTVSADGRLIGFAGLALNSQIWTQAIDRDGTPAGPPKPLTSDTSRRNSVPAVSPDGSRVAYMSTRRGELPNIWMMDIEGRNPIQLTPDDTAEFSPDWSPDGRRVAYLSNRGATRNLWSVDVATRREKLLFDTARTPDSAAGAAPLEGRLAELDVAPSMTSAAFSLIAPPAGRRMMYVTGIAPFAPRRLTDGTVSVGYPAWSPDERYLAVEMKDGSSTNAGIIDVKTGALTRLTNGRGQTWVRSWSPDGRRIAMAVLREGAWSLRSIDVASGREGAITPPWPARVFVRYPDWSPRGDCIVFERGEMRGNIWMLALK
jgi:Tol biopolymer transport system component/DNA-binding winged helix-turn-helix (wHTH) protein